MSLRLTLKSDASSAEARVGSMPTSSLDTPAKNHLARICTDDGYCSSASTPKSSGLRSGDCGEFQVALEHDKATRA
ncbi:hypothetical protein TNCV_2455081 [Trichonephila clavipes]|nr:hypothetical protein TNCV_2455081 [Trichonephila clavipes]